LQQKKPHKESYTRGGVPLRVTSVITLWFSYSEQYVL